MFDPIIYTKCIDFAAQKHGDQRQKDAKKTPYINHIIGITRLLAEADITEIEVLMAAILHKTVKHTDATFDELEEHFEKTVRNIVAAVMDIKNIPEQERTRSQMEYSKSTSHRAKLIKLAEKLYSLRDLERRMPNGWTEKRRHKYFKWEQKRVENLRDTNKRLEESLDEISRRNR